jgi:hypothetical protein
MHELRSAPRAVISAYIAECNCHQAKALLKSIQRSSPKKLQEVGNGRRPGSGVPLTAGGGNRGQTNTGAKSTLSPVRREAHWKSGGKQPLRESRGVLQREVGLVEEGGHQRLAVLGVEAAGVHHRLLQQGLESTLQDLEQTKRLYYYSYYR